MEPQQNGDRIQGAGRTGVGSTSEAWSEVRAWDRRMMDRAFVAALRGEDVREIGKYQVYSDYRENETVVFIHDPTGQSEHKYIFARTEGHTYRVAAPLHWTEYHRDILNCVRDVAGSKVFCEGGGYVTQQPGGELVVNRRSQDFGAGDHERAKKAFEDAVRNTVKRGGEH